MARTRGGGLGARGRPRGRGAQTDRMDIVEKVENENKSGDIPQNTSLSEASISNERSDGRVHSVESR